MRTGRTVAPTEFGIAILDCDRNLLREARELTTVTVSNGVVGELRIGATSTALAGLLPGILASSTRKFPQVRLYLAGRVCKTLSHGAAWRTGCRNHRSTTLRAARDLFVGDFTQ